MSPVALLHGRLSPAEKEEIFRQFAAGEKKILVSTAVVEVGVDVPAATVMWIEGAERFGLAQLHQFRGRVGRGKKKSYCFLFTSSGAANERLREFARTSDGFQLAEIDLKTRGPGEFLGTRQAGLPDLKMASLSDPRLLRAARAAAEFVEEAS